MKIIKLYSTKECNKRIQNGECGIVHKKCPYTLIFPSWCPLEDG